MAKPNPKLRGIPGGRWIGGKLYGFEHNPKLRGPEWIKACQRMLTDPVILSARNAHRNSLLSATFYLEPGITGDVESERLCTFVAENFGLNGHAGLMEAPFERQVAKLLHYLDNGFRYFENDWEVTDKADRVIFRGWADRHPMAHHKWLSKDGHRLDGVLQRKMSWLDKPAPIPANQLLLLVNEQEAQNWEGRGLLRACHFDYELLIHTMNMAAIALERWGLSTPHMKYDRREILESLDQPSPDAVQAAITAAGETMDKYLAQELGALISTTGIDFTTYGDGQLNPSAFEAIEQMVTRRVQYAYLVQFMSLGVSGVGARNVGEVHQAFFYAACVNQLDYLCGRISGQGRRGAGTIGRLVEFNFGKVDPRKLPRLRHQGLSPEPLMQALNVLGQLRQHNLITDTNELEDQLLQRFKAGRLTAEARELRKARHEFQKADPGAAATTQPTTQPQPKPTEDKNKEVDDE